MRNCQPRYARIRNALGKLTYYKTSQHDVSQNCLDVRHPEEVFEVAGVRQGLLVAPRTEKKDLGGARLDIFHTP